MSRMINVGSLEIMLGMFPKVFAQAATSQRYFHKWQFPNQQLPKVVLAAALGLKSNPRRSARPPPLAHPSHDARPYNPCSASDGLTLPLGY